MGIKNMDSNLVPNFGTASPPLSNGLYNVSRLIFLCCEPQKKLNNAFPTDLIKCIGAGKVEAKKVREAKISAFITNTFLTLSN